MRGRIGAANRRSVQGAKLAEVSMSLPIKSLILICALVAGAGLLWMRHSAYHAPPVTAEQPPQVQHQPGNLRKAGPAPAVNSDRLAKTADDNDLFNFVATSGAKALNGDGTAALQISKILQKCLVIKKVYGDTKDPDAELENQWATKNVPSWVVDRARTDLQACKAFIHGDAFANLPNRVGGYESMRFWSDLAYQEKSPVAIVSHAASAVVTDFASNNTDPSKRQTIQMEINNAAITGNPEALFRIGLLLSDGRVGVDALEGYSVMIAACDLGYDCTTNNELAFGACVSAGTCQQGEIYSDVIKKTVGEGGYDQAASRAQQLEDAISRGDSSAVLQYVQLKQGA
jgi:hypothetical protein